MTTVKFFKGQLDYEKQTIHQVKVLAIDRAKEGKINTGTAVVLVKVEDVEDQPPEFVTVTSVARLEENSPIGTSVIQGIHRSYKQTDLIVYYYSYYSCSG